MADWHTGPGVGALDSRYVNTAGDTMTGALDISAGSPGLRTNSIAVHSGSTIDLYGLILQSATFQDHPFGGIRYQGLINGGMDVWQRGATFTPNDDVYVADRWNFLTETNGSWTVARDTDVPDSTLHNQGFKYSMKFSNVTLNKQCGIVQIIENVDARKFLNDSGAYACISFYAKTNGTEIANLRTTLLSWSSTADAVTSDVIGTWAQDGTDPTWATNWTAEVAGANLALTSGWQRFVSQAIVIDTASMTNLAVVIWTDDGTIAANDDFFITGVQLSAVNTAPIPYPSKSYAEELAACQRYCQSFVSVGTNERVFSGHAVSTTEADFVVNLRPTMFTTPTLVSTATDWKNSDGVTATDVTSMSLPSSIFNSPDHVTVAAAVASGLTQYRPYWLEGDGSASRRINFEAEL